MQLVADALTPYAQHSVETFFAFLEKAHTYATTGVLPVVATKAPSRGRATAKPKADPVALKEQALRFYQRLVELSPDEFQVERTALDQLQALTKPDLLKIAEALELFGLKNKSKGDIYDQIQAKIVNRRGSSQRAEMVYPQT